MIDNFKLIQQFHRLTPCCIDQDKFLFGQIMVRKKDGSPFATSDNKIIKDVVFNDLEDFERKKEEIVALCDLYKARCYINVNARSYNTIAIDVAGVCLDQIRTGGVKAVRKAFSTACGRSKPKKGCWLIDVDEISEKEKILSYISHDPWVLEVPTVNGCHIITTPFDLRPLTKEFPHLDIHKNNPTLLYSFK